ncbi:DNRLRE domain-containing protein [Saccharothrix hoggarensis]|uniref:DNRLRE domain-containing protein n=1 Tax=Saccharothrix hoggarensis TaxID=913853 RepID=A0ABW3QHG6_9PSEU
MIVVSVVGLPAGPSVTGPGRLPDLGFSGLWRTVSGWFAPGEAQAAPDEPAPDARAVKTPIRVRELEDRRTSSMRVFQLSNGEFEAVASARPEYFRDAQGRWRRIDTAVRESGRDGYRLGNDSNVFGSAFGDRTDKLVRFQSGDRHVALGVDAEARNVEPRVEGNRVVYPGVFDGADLAYVVTGESLKEEIVLHRAPGDATYRFTLQLGGVTARALPDGAIGFFPNDAVDGPPVFTMPRPFMFDGAEDRKSPHGRAWSDKVTQTVEQQGSKITITVKADREWLASGDREYPVTIDPTVKLQPTPTTGQDVQIWSDTPDRNDGSSYQLSVGADAWGKARSLLRFDTSVVPAGTALSSAKLRLYYDSELWTGANSNVHEVRRVTSAWSEDTATWNSINAATAEAGLSTATKQAGVANVWHDWDVRDIAQSWVSGSAANHGLMVKSTDETLGKGGAIYQAAEFAYNGEIENSPKLVLTYGRPSADLKYPTKIYATGAELAWGPYVDPDPANPNDDAVEYQVHRTVFQAFTPSASTLIAPLAPTTTSFTDTTARPTPADSADPFGNAYYYMVAVKTRDGRLIPGPTQVARLPKSGLITQVFHGGASDATLASNRPDTNLDTLGGRPWLMVGNNSTTYGRTRAVVKWNDLSAIPAGARIVDADLMLWGFFSDGGGATFDGHPLTRGFVENQATWNRASTATAWTTPGGDLGAAADQVVGMTNDPKWHIWENSGLVQGWVDNPASNNGFEVKLRDEAGPQQRVLFLSDEAQEPQLRPNLVVTYTQPTAEMTYYAPDTPSVRMIPGDEYTIPVSVTNSTTTTWRAADQVLSYRWNLPDGTDVTTGGNRLETALPGDVLPGGTVTVQARVKTPIQSEAGNKREQFVLNWDLRNKTAGTWLSATGGVPALPQNVTVEDPTSDQLGLEKFYQYVGTGTGSGTGLKVNPYVGNTVWNYDPFSNPGRGLATFVRMTYNSADTASTSMGHGWSLAASSIMRLGTPLDLHPKGQDHPTTTTLTDGDGTSHTFELNKNGSTDPARWTYDRPAGVHLHLQRDPGPDPSRRWVMTRPDRTRFWFDDGGWLTAIRDKNANELTFSYTERKSNNQPRKFLSYITDPTSRRTLAIDYYDKGQTHDYFENGVRKTGTNLTNPKIIDQVESIKDISGRTLALTYSDKGLMEELVDGAGATGAKTFRFAYDATQGNKNVKLVKVTDPRGNATDLAYFTAPVDPKDKWKVRTITDRGRGVSSFAYVDPDGTAGSVIEATATDAENKTTKYTMDGYGRPTKVVNAENETTELTWDADNKVVAAKAPNGALTTWTYDAKTGVPTSVRDPEANKNNTPAGTLDYRFELDGHIADLTSKTSPEGRRWQFAHDAKGNLTSVTDPKGTATPTAGDHETTYTYDEHGQLLVATDANGNPTTYSDYDPVGYPRTSKDALGNTTATVYDVRGNVTSVTDAQGKTTTQTYDVFGRPLESRVPKDAAAGEFIVTPAPEYDPNGNITRKTAPNGAVSGATYDALDQMVAASLPKDDPSGPVRTATFAYDKVGNVLGETTPMGNLTPADPGDRTTRYEYDDVYRLTASVNALGGRATVEYDSVGNAVTVVDPRKNATADAADFTTKYTHDLNGKVLTETDALGNVLRNEYDRDGNAVANVDQDGNRTEIRFDERAKPVEIRVPHKVDGSTAVTRVTRYEYDEVGNRTREITPRGVETADDPDDFVRQTVYDQLNRVKEEITPYDRDDARYKTPDKVISTYDAVGNLVETSAPPSGDQTVRNTSKYTHFDNGWVRTSTDAWDIVSSYEYDSVGNQTKSTLSSAGGAVSRTIDSAFYPDGKLRSKTDDGVPVGTAVALVDNSDTANTATAGTWSTSGSGASHQGYDYRTAAAGTGTSTFTWTPIVAAQGTYEVSVRYAAGTATNAPYTVHHAGGVTTVPVDQTTRAGEWVSLGRFAFTEGNTHKVVLANAANGTVVADAVRLARDNTGDTDTEKKTFAYAYDADGNLASLTDNGSGARVDTYAMTYDGLDQLTKVEEKSAGAVRNTTSFSYDPVGNPLTRGHDRQSATFEYDPRDLVTKVTNTESGDTPKTTTFTHTKRGEIDLETRGNGNVVDYDYFLDKQVRRQTEKTATGTLVAEHNLEYSPNGHRVRDAAKRMNADDNAAYLDHVYEFTYDPRDRIAKLTRSAAAGGVQETETYVHDANGNITEETVEGKTTTSAYDRNRLVSSSSGGSTSTYNYDPLGRLDTVSSAGTILEKYTYDGFDRVATHRQTKPDKSSETTKYAYDPYDRTTARTEKSGGSGEETTVFSYLGLSDEVAAEEIDGTLKKTYTFGPWNERLGMVKHDGAKEYSYYSYNAHTDVELITKEDGKARATYGYTAYGKDDTQVYTGVDKPDAANPDKKPYNTYRFNAKRMDPATGDYDMGARDYDPQLNRFLTRDMYNGALSDMALGTDPFTMNRYAFAGGNPISGIEIDGHLFGMSWSDLGHLALDVVGLVPVIGEAADLANAAWYAAEGDYVNAALSAASAIPFAGYAATGAKLAIKGADAVSGAVKASDEVVAAATKSGDEVAAGATKAAPAPAAAPARAAPSPAQMPKRAPAPAPAKVAPSKAPSGGGDVVSVWKAPGKGAGQRTFDQGFRKSDYPGSPGARQPDPDGTAYFAKERGLADTYARSYGEGVIEVRVPRGDYDRLFRQFERKYQGGPLIELRIPADVVEKLNRYPRVWHR